MGRAFHRWLVGIDDTIGYVENGFLIAAHAVIAILVVAGVVLRYLFHDPLVWGQEFIVGLFTWAVFIGAALAAQTGMVGPLSTILMGVLILGEPFTAWVAAGTALVLAGIWMLARRR